MDPISSPPSSSCDKLTNNNQKANATSGLHSSESIYLLKADNVFYFNGMSNNAFNFNNTNSSRSADVNVSTNNDETQTKQKTQSLKKNSLEIEEYDENYEEGYLTTLNKENSLTDINQIEDTLPTTTPLVNASINTFTSSTTTTIMSNSSCFVRPINFTTLDVPIRESNVVKQTVPMVLNKKNALLLSKKSKSISNADEPYDLNQKKTNSNTDLNKAITMVTTSTDAGLPVNTLKTQYPSMATKTLKTFNIQSNSNLSVNKQSVQIQSPSTSPKKVKKVLTSKNKEKHMKNLSDVQIQVLPEDFNLNNSNSSITNINNNNSLQNFYHPNHFNTHFHHLNSHNQKLNYEWSIYNENKTQLDEIERAAAVVVLVATAPISGSSDLTHSPNASNISNAISSCGSKDVDQTLNSGADSQCSNTSVKESLPLKRTQAIPDLHNMDDFSPVTFESSVLGGPINKLFVDDNNLCEIDQQPNSKFDYIEETKVIVPGIKVRAAKLSKLIGILIESFDEVTGDVLPNIDFPRVFYLMHKWFMESNDLANMIYDLYLTCEQQKQQNQQKKEELPQTEIPLSTPISSTMASSTIFFPSEMNKQDLEKYQLKICHALSYWINKFPFHFALDMMLIESVKRFSNLILDKGDEDQLKLIDISNIESYDWMRKLTTRNSNRSKEKIALAFDKLEPEVIASQLTYLEWKTLRRVSFSDYKSYAIKGSIQDNPPLERSIQLFNGLSQWIQCMVLSKTTPKQRADIIHKFLEVAQHLRNFQNFNSLMAVIGGICHSALSRLSKTNLYLSVEDQKILCDMTELLSSNCNYGQYRKTISEIQPQTTFWIPIIGIHLKDMISLHTAHLDKLENDLINFRKMAQLSIIFQKVTDLQNSIPPFQENRDLIKLLQLSLDMIYSEDEIYELSLAREPRTSVSSPSQPSRISAFADWAKSISTPPDPQTIQKHVNAMVDAVFKNYDYDRDGFISQAEFSEIAQNFPFIDSFAVLDADKDGMISRAEMKNYFLRANYHALKSEFKHEFHETTYFKPVFCTHCDGFLWGLIKQGWKCKDCGINAHKLCKDRVVIECRSKRNFIPTSRQTSSTSGEKHNFNAMARASSRDQPKLKQKSTQTDTYDDLFMSDESISSNEDTTNNESLNKQVSSLVVTTNDWLFEHQSLDTANKASNTVDHQQLGSRTTKNRHRPYKKAPKRRKSLPSQCSSNDIEPHPSVTLIPRGPLICSNLENFDSWLPERLYLANSFHNSTIGNKVIDTEENSTSNIKANLDSTTTEIESSSNSTESSITMPAHLTTQTLKKSQEDIEPKYLSIKPPRLIITNSNLSSSMYGNSYLTNKIESGHYTKQTHSPNASPSSHSKKSPTTAKNLTKSASPIVIKTIPTNVKSNLSSSIINNPKETSTPISPIIPVSYKPKPLVPAAIYPQFIKLEQLHEAKKLLPINRSRIQSECDINFIIEPNQYDQHMNENIYSSTDEENEVFIKLRLKEAEMEKEKLTKENAKIKQELESANAQITSLKEKMSTIKVNDTITNNNFNIAKIEEFESIKDSSNA